MSVVAAELHPHETGLTLRLRPAVELTDEQFFDLCQLNADLQLERSAEGDIIVMPPAGGEASNRNLAVSGQLYIWTTQDGTGAAFDSSAGFKLPNGATRSPDAAWVLRDRMAQLTSEEKRRFIPLCPDFVVELLSPTDSLAVTQAKMHEYIENGARLGFLIHPDARRVYVYRPGLPIEELNDASEVSGDPELAGLILDLHEIWQPNI